MRGWFAVLPAWAALLALSACGQEGNDLHLNSQYLKSYADSNPTPADFSECHGFGCSAIDAVDLSPQQWTRVRAQFKPPAKDARAERRQISAALALMQSLVGAQTGTAVHQWTRVNRKIGPNYGDLSQLDCIDEAVNTWTYLTMMDHDGLLRFHSAGPLSYGGTIFNLDMRNTAVIRDNTTGLYYAVDPTMVDETENPPIFPLTIWLGKWPPTIPAADKS
jgi:hypothetical protein